MAGVYRRNPRGRVSVAEHRRRLARRNVADSFQATSLLRQSPRAHALDMPFVQLTAIIVEDYDPAIAFFVDALGFELVEDSPALTNSGMPKRWLVVRPPGAQTGILLARADGDIQAAIVGNQVAAPAMVAAAVTGAAAGAAATTVVAVAPEGATPAATTELAAW